MSQLSFCIHSPAPRRKVHEWVKDYYRVPRLREISLLHFVKPAGLHVVDVAMDGDTFRHQGMGLEALHVIAHALRLIFDGEPLDEFAGPRTGPLTHVLETAFVQSGSL